MTALQALEALAKSARHNQIDESRIIVMNVTLDIIWMDIIANNFNVPLVVGHNAEHVSQTLP